MGDAVVTMLMADSAESAHPERYTESADDPRRVVPAGGDKSAMQVSRSEENSALSGLSFGRRLRRLRMRQGWTQLVLAQRMRDIAVDHGGTAELISLKAMISKWENGHKEPDEFNRRLLAAALGATVADLGLAEDPDFLW
ncbi:hypothetical protein GCM10010109_63990 [Actinoplanes campanulatus]|nr:hypothetical protein GCM10010109_63990 [Actinoplanes campanulatus]GID39755.1 hypothetical protein Aca09nite_62610 [Actinoplanes campanulatus]